MIDPFSSYNPALVSPAGRHFLIVPSDSADLPIKPRVIYCHAAGSIVVRDEVGTDLPYSMVAGQLQPFRGTRVLAMGASGTFYGWV